MDVEKLLKVLQDIQSEQAKHDVTTLITSIIAAMNPNTAEGYQEAQRLKSSLDTVFSASSINDYSPSFRQILLTLGAANFTGNDGKNYFSSIFAGNALQSLAAVNSYLAEYNTFLSKVQAAVSSLDSLGVVAYELDEFEVGFIVPVGLSSLETISKKLQRWNKFLALASEIAGETGAKTSKTLKRVNNGSLEFFIASSIGGATVIDTVLRRIFSLYQELQKILKTRQEIESLKLDNEHKRKMLDALDDSLKTKSEEFKEATLDAVFKSSKVQNDREPELRAQFGMMIQFVLNDVQDGIQIEINPPEKKTGSPEPGSEDPTQTIRPQIVELNKDLVELYSQPAEQLKLPFKIELPEDEAPKRQTTKKPTRSPKK